MSRAKSKPRTTRTTRTATRSGGASIPRKGGKRKPDAAPATTRAVVVRPRRNQTAAPTSIAQVFDKFRSDYEAAHDSRLKRKRSGYLPTGSNADYHLRNGFDHLKIMEQARAMDRDDAIIGQLVDRVVLNTIQNGFTVDPKTGDPSLDADLWERFNSWAIDPAQCDAQGERDFARLQEIVYRQRLVDGDCFVLPLEDGTLQIMEGHRCRSPIHTKDNVVLGIKLDPNTRQREEYWFTNEDVDPMAPAPRAFDDFDRVPAFDADGEPLVWHILDQRRDSQTRGISAFAPIMITATMADDIMLAKLVQQQIVSCVTFFRKRSSEFQGGAPEGVGPEERFMWGAFEAMVQQMSPGLELMTQPGEDIEIANPNVPNETFFPHIRFIVQLIGINLGMPLVMVLMDASDTNFSGWRGAVDQAQRGFKRNQHLLISQFHSRVYRWRLRQELANDAALRETANRVGPKFFNHAWTTPKWPYIQPLQDAQADALRLEKRLTSPRRMHAEHGQDYDDINDETIADNKRAIMGAITASEEVFEAKKVRVHWREFLHIATPTPANVVIEDEDESKGGKRAPVGPQEARR